MACHRLLILWGIVIFDRTATVDVNLPISFEHNGSAFAVPNMTAPNSIGVERIDLSVIRIHMTNSQPQVLSAYWLCTGR